MNPRSLFARTLPPLPNSAENAPCLMWHPVKKELWAFDPAAQTIWRVNADGTGALLFAKDKVAVPASVNLRYTHRVAFYWDAARKAPVYLFATYTEIALGVLRGAAFAPVAQKNVLEVPPSSADAFVFDSRRNVLVHFVSTHDSSVKEGNIRKARGGLTVRELGVDGAWRDVGKPLAYVSEIYGMAGWDERLGQAVYVERGTHGWDGSAWSKLPAFPVSTWFPYFTGTSPRTGALVVLQKQCGDDDRMAAHELDGRKWREIDTGDLEEAGGLARDEEAKVTYVYGPWFGAGTVQHTLGVYDGKRIAPAGCAAPEPRYGSTRGPVRFLGTRGSVRTNRPAPPPLCFTVSKDALVHGKPLPEGMAHLVDASGELTLTGTGELFGIGKTKIAAPRGFAKRCATNVGTDGNGTLLVVGGEVSFGARRLTDTWRFDGAWKKLEPKGAAPASVNAGVAYDASRAMWLVVGGRAKDFSTLNAMSELDDKKWTTFPLALSDEKKLDKIGYAVTAILAYDEASARVLYVRASYDIDYKLYAYEGGGKFRLLAALDVPRDSAFAWDAARRVLVAASPGALVEFDLAASLDALTPGAATKTQPIGAAKATAKAAKVAPAVWLHVVDGDTQRFWFAALEGNARTERAGVRGKAAKTKRRVSKTASAARAQYEAAVREKLEEGYEHAPDKEAAAIVPGRMSFRMKLGKGKAKPGADVMGGSGPQSTPRGGAPNCKECGTPMTHVALLHAHEERLPLKQHAAIAVYVCNNEETAGMCEFWDPDMGSNAALLLKKASGRAAVDKKSDHITLPEHPITYEAFFEPDPADNANVDDPESVSKLSGFPAWLQGDDDTPSCKKCKKAMRFVAQLREFDELNLAQGDGYLFCCPAEHTATFLCQR